MNYLDIPVGFLSSFWEISKQMAPWLLFGFLVAGIMSELIPESVMERLAGKPGLGSIIKVSLLGIPLPICSCGIVPVSAALKKRGASQGAVSAFLITTPQTGAESIAVTWSMLGWIFALFRVAAAFFTGIICGIAVEYFAPPHEMKDESELAAKPCCHNEDCSEEKEPEPAAESCCHSTKSCELEETEQSSCCHSKKSTVEPNSFTKVVAYAFDDLPRDLGNLLLIGLAVAAALDFFLPKDLLEGIGQTPWALLIMLAAGLPMYVCSTASVPIAATLLMKGVSPGAALVFLVTGPATNAAALTALSKIIGKKALVIYLTTLIILSLIFGFVLDLIPGVNGAAMKAMEHAGHGTDWLGIISAVLLYLIIVRIWIKKFILQKRA
jgi:uncharacterized membrane protein YraQ (UPF0718 family)